MEYRIVKRRGYDGWEYFPQTKVKNGWEDMERFGKSTKKAAEDYIKNDIEYRNAQEDGDIVACVMDVHYDDPDYVKALADLNKKYPGTLTRRTNGR
jgi:hypothetical protein